MGQNKKKKKKINALYGPGVNNSPPLEKSSMPVKKKHCHLLV